jgi:hypothetical protein
LKEGILTMPGLRGFIVGLAIATTIVVIIEIAGRYRLLGHLMWAARIATATAVYLLVFRPAYPDTALGLEILAIYWGGLFVLIRGLMLLAEWLHKRHGQRNQPYHPDPDGSIRRRAGVPRTVPTRTVHIIDGVEYPAIDPDSFQAELTPEAKAEVAKKISRERAEKQGKGGGRP